MSEYLISALYFGGSLQVLPDLAGSVKLCCYNLIVYKWVKVKKHNYSRTYGVKGWKHDRVQIVQTKSNKPTKTNNSNKLYQVNEPNHC